MRGQRCKGTRDLSPEEMRKFRLIEGVFRDCCLNWGYQEVRTPTIEYLYLFTSTGTLTPGRLGRVYSFLDWDGWSGERVVLRPDGTIPIARMYVDTMADNRLARLFYVDNVFVFEETGEETRERWQCGAELIGAGSTLADAELIVLSLEVLKTLGLQGLELRLSHAELIRALLVKFGLSPKEQADIIDRLLDGDAEAMNELRSQKSELGAALAPLLDMNGKSAGFLKNMKVLFNQGFTEMEEPLKHFIDTVELLDTMGVDYRIDIASGRGFEYYTGIMFRFLVNNEPVGGGGRYDALIPMMGGGDIPASGFAFYVDRLMDLIEPEAITKPAEKRILIKPVGEESGVVKKAFGMAGRLRGAGYSVEIHLGGDEPTGPRWTLDVQGKTPALVLTDRKNNKQYQLQKADEVLATVQGVR